MKSTFLSVCKNFKIPIGCAFSNLNWIPISNSCSFNDDHHRMDFFGIIGFLMESHQEEIFDSCDMVYVILLKFSVNDKAYYLVLLPGSKQDQDILKNLKVIRVWNRNDHSYNCKVTKQYNNKRQKYSSQIGVENHLNFKAELFKPILMYITNEKRRSFAYKSLICMWNQITVYNKSNQFNLTWRRGKLANSVIKISNNCANNLIANDHDLNDKRYGTKSKTPRITTKVKALNREENSERVESEHRRSNHVCDWELTTLKGVFGTTLWVEDINQAIGQLRNKMDNLNMNPLQQDNVICAISSKLFQDVGWQLGMPKPLDNFKILKATIDIDQTVLEIKIQNKINNSQTIDNFLNEYYDGLLNKLESDPRHQFQYHAGMININYQKFCQHHQFQRGHTYMANKKRKTFIGIITQGSCHESLKVSVALKGDKNRSIKDHDIVFNAMREVAFWFNQNKKEALRGVQNDAYTNDHIVPDTISVEMGTMFPFMVVFYLLYQDIVDEIVVETFGGKSRYSREIDDVNSIDDNEINRITEDMFKYLHGSAILFIKRFKDFSIEKLNVEPTIIWGIGSTVDTKAGESFGYTVINPPIQKCPYYDSIGNPTAYFAKDSKIDSFLKPYVPLMSKNRKWTNYSIFGGALHLHMQPTNINGDLLQSIDGLDEDVTRYQHYSIRPRNAIGEIGMTDKITSQAANLSKDIYHEKNTNDNFWNMHKTKRSFEMFYKCCVQNLEDTALKGGPARVEIAYSKKRVDKNYNDFEFLKKSIRNSINIIKRYTIAYDSFEWMSYVKLYLDGILLRYLNLFKINMSMENMDIICNEILDIKTRIYQFYSGKNLLSNERLCLPKCATLSNRSIFTLSEGELEELTRKALVLPGNICAWKFFKDCLGYTEYPRPRLEGAPFEFKIKPSGKVCDHCFAIFDHHTLKEFDNHNCIVEGVGRPIDLSCDSYGRHVDHEYSKLDKDQKLVMDSVKRNLSNLFFTGFAGAGKSHTLSVAIKWAYKNYGTDGVAVLAKTKSAADVVGGVTLNSFFGIGLEELSAKPVVDLVKLITDKNRLPFFRYFLKIIFIDEVGLVPCDDLTKIDELFRYIRNDRKDEPFGGIHIVLCGDPLQIPPITDNDFNKFFFESPAFWNGDFEVAYLKNCHRQKDQHHIALLNRIRYGKDYLLDNDIKYINNNWGKDVDYEDADKIIKIMNYLKTADWNNYRKEGDEGKPYQKLKNKIEKMYHYNYLAKQRDHSNKDRLKKKLDHHLSKLQRGSLESLGQLKCMVIHLENVEVEHFVGHLDNMRLKRNDIKIYDSVDKIQSVVVANTKKFQFQNYQSQMEKKTSLVETLCVFVGMKVFFTSNKISPFVANNGTGIVKMITEDAIYVEPILSDRKLIPKTIKVTRMEYSADLKDFNDKLVTIFRTQFPLSPADCGNHYTTQGLTIRTPLILNPDRLMQNMHYGVFYVAASRVERESMMFPLREICEGDITAHPLAVQFDQIFYNSPNILNRVSLQIKDGIIDTCPYFLPCVRRRTVNRNTLDYDDIKDIDFTQVEAGDHYDEDDDDSY